MYVMAGGNMGEDSIHRTTVYIPKHLYIIAKSRDINMSQAFTRFLEKLIKEDEEKIILKEIEKHKEAIRQLEAKLELVRQRKKEQEATQKALHEVAMKIAKWLTQRLKQIPDVNATFFIKKTREILQRDYGIIIENDELLELSHKVKSNGSVIEKEDIIPYIMQKEVIHA